MQRKCPYHNRILVKKVEKVPINPIAVAPDGSYPYRLVIWRVCPVPGCDYRVRSDEEP